MYGVIGNEKREWNPDCILHLWKKNGLFGNEWMEWSVKHLLRSFVRNKKHIHTNKRLTQEFCNLIHRKFDCRTILEIKRTLNQLLLLLLQLQNLLFNRILNDQSIDRHFAFLSNSERSIDCLVFNSLVPPWIDHKNCICWSEIEAHSSRSKGN